MIKKLTSGKCAKCQQQIDYFTVEGVDNKINLANYSFFKNPVINICPKCGYINDDLSENNALFQNSHLKLESSSNIYMELINNIKIDRIYAKSLIDFEKLIRVYANIFDNNKLILNKFLSKNYTKDDAESSEVLKSLKENLKNSALEIISLIDENINEKNNDIFVKLLNIEVLSCLNKVSEAKSILSKLTNLSPDLFDYIEDCIYLGGLV